jgi:activating signal cointegrator complex subunit 1
MLRDKFIEAGFILGEDKDKQQDYQKDKQTNDRKEAEGEQPPSKSEIAPVLLDPWTAALRRKPKPRPLLLHATIVNTIYVRGRPRPKPDGLNPKKDKNKSRRLEIDARDILARYRDYYVDEARTIPRTEPATYVENTSAAENEDNRGEIISAMSSPQYPFVWAKDIPIDTVCICEMGARKLPLDTEDAELNKRLGEKYTVIAQRNLQALPVSTPVTAGSAGVTES